MTDDTVIRTSKTCDHFVMAVSGLVCQIKHPSPDDCPWCKIERLQTERDEWYKAEAAWNWSVLQLLRQVAAGERRANEAQAILDGHRVIERPAPETSEDPALLSLRIVADGVGVWLLHRFGPNTPEGAEGKTLLNAVRASEKANASLPHLDTCNLKYGGSCCTCGLSQSESDAG